MASLSCRWQFRRPGSQVEETPQEQQEVDRPGSVAPPEHCGGYDCEFVERPRELQMDCPICLLVLREPFQIACCGNSFCRTCIERIQTNKKACPTCNKANFAVFSDKRLRRSLYVFRVRCVHQKSGCEWTGELGELERHLNLNLELGKQLIGCAFAEVACTHCREYFQRRHVHTHQSEACPQRPFSCDYCEDYGSVYEDIVSNHWPVCKCYPVPCPNECGVSPERQNVETHVNTACPLTVVNCDFHYTGCEVQLVRKDMPTHLAESLVNHLSLLALHNQQLTQLTMQQKESLEELKKENKALKLKVSKDVSQEVAELKRQQKKSLQENQQKIQELEQKTLTSQREIGVLKMEVNNDVVQDVVKLRSQLKENLEECQRKIQKLEKEKQASIHEIEALKLKVNENMEQEVADLRRQQVEDRVSLVTLQQQIGMLPPVRLTMTNYEEMKQSNQQWYSPPFYTHQQGYKMCLNVYANGLGIGEGTHVSVFAYLMRGEFDDFLKWPFKGSVVLQLCNQLEDKKHQGHIIDFSKTTNPKHISRVTSGERGNGWGIHVFIAHNDLKFKRANKCQYLKDDCLHFRIITVESLSEPGVLPTELTMTNFEQHKTNNDQWYSPPFYTHPQGYKMCLDVYANGNGDGKGTHVSAFTHLMRGEFDDRLKWPFQGSVVLQLCNQLEDKKHCGYIIDFSKTTYPKVISRVTSGERAESGLGAHTLIAHNDLNVNYCQYLKNDCLQFRIITVESLSEPRVLPTERTMTNFEQNKIDNDDWFSPPFYTHPRGYKMCLNVDANGYGDGEGTHVSVWAYLMRGEFDDNLKWPFQGGVTVAMLNQLEDGNHTTETIRFTTTTEAKYVGRVTGRERAPSGLGSPTFIAHTDLDYNPVKNCQYLKYDCLHFRIVKVELK